MRLAAFGFVVLLSAGSGFALADDLDGAFQDFKQAEAQKDTAKLKELAASTYALAHKLVSAPAPESATEKEGWAQNVERGKAVQVYVEYALLAAALRGPAATTVDLVSTLEQQNPKSKYLDQVYGSYIDALAKTGAGPKTQAAAEKAIANFPENEDLLLYLAETTYSRKQNAASLNYAKRLTVVLNRHPKPEGMSAADWERKKTAALGRGYCLAGVLLTGQNQYQEADKNLRAALPLVKGNDTLRAQVLYFLGLANYQFGVATNNRAMVSEAAKFSEEAAEIPGPLQANARQNAYAMKQQMWKMR